MLEQERELKKQKLDNIIQDFEWRADRLQAIADEATARIDLKQSVGMELNEDDYASAIEASNRKLALLVQQRAEMLAEFKRLVAEGTILEGSEDWHSYTAQLEQLEVSMINVQKSVADFQKSVQQIAIDKLNYALDTLKDAQDKAQQIIDEKTQTGRKITESDYSRLISSAQQQIGNLEQQNALMRQYQVGLDTNSERYQQLEKDIRANEKAIWDARMAQLGWNEAILNLPIINLQNTLKAIQTIRDTVEGMNKLHVAQGLDPTREFYQELVDLGMQEINNLEEQNRLYRERLSSMEVESDKWNELNDQIVENEKAILA